MGWGGRPTSPSHLLCCVCNTLARILPRSSVRAWNPLREAALGLQRLLGAALPGEHVPTPGERLSVQLAAVRPL